MAKNIKINWNDTEIRAKVRQAIDVGSKKAAEEIFSKAKNAQEFKDKTGNLRKSIKMKKSKFKDGGFVVAAYAPHSHLVEYGHAGGAGPRPFMRNALAACRDKSKKTIIDEVEKALR